MFCCVLCAIKPTFEYRRFWRKDEEHNPKKIEWDKRIHRFTYLDLLLGQAGYVFAAFITMHMFPLLKESMLIFPIPIFFALAAKPFYVFWLKGEFAK